MYFIFPFPLKFLLRIPINYYLVDLVSNSLSFLSFFLSFYSISGTISQIYLNSSSKCLNHLRGSFFILYFFIIEFLIVLWI